MKEKEKEVVCDLRKQGLSVDEICRKTNVSKSTVFHWIRNIILTKEQYKKLKDSKGRSFDGVYKGSLVMKQKSLLNRKEYQNIGREKIKQKEDEYVAGCMLYWAEGGKARNVMRFVNSDVEMVKFFIKFLRKYFNVKNDDFRIRVNCYLNNGLSEDEIKKYWLNILQLPESCMKKCQIKQGGRSKGKLLYGICELSVCDTQLVQQIFGSIQGYIGFEEIKWLS